jgi:hypothetical protein
MRQGGILLVTVAVLACTACLGDQGKLEIRSSATGLKASSEPVPYRIAEARGHLALGNVALALEGFRKAAREDPSSVDALAGIALCYDRMGRFDLSRRNYEMALALAPRDPALLSLLAGSLDRQGLTKEAASVRREMAALAIQAPAVTEVAVRPPQLIAEANRPAPAPLPAAPERAAPVGHSVTIALPPPRPIGVAEPKSSNAQAMVVAPVGHSVTVALPPPRPAPIARTPAPAPAPVKEAMVFRQPRLERMSLTEVALITGNGPRWKRAVPPQVMAATRNPPANAIEVRLLNAARVDKLAARTRAFLGRFGWREMAIGDAATVRARSLIVYPQGTQAAARRLSARLGFAMAERSDVRQVTILLGRDAAAHPGLRPRA